MAYIGILSIYAGMIGMNEWTDKITDRRKSFLRPAVRKIVVFITFGSSFLKKKQRKHQLLLTTGWRKSMKYGISTKLGGW